MHELGGVNPGEVQWRWLHVSRKKLLWRYSPQMSSFLFALFHFTAICFLTIVSKPSKMASSYSPENTMHDTAAPVTTTVPDAGITSTLRGVTLNDCWRIGEQLPTSEKKHATVYLVLDTSNLPVDGLEAHAFTLDVAQPKIRKHRLRCIKRMTPRTKLEVKVQDTVIIIISTLSAADNQSSEKTAAIDRPVVMENSPKAHRKAAAKTPHEQESARIRQRERRKARRSKKGEQHPDTPESEEKRTERTNLDGDKDLLVFLTALYMLYDETGTKKKEISTAHRELFSRSVYESFERYLKHTTIEFESPADMKSYLIAIREEKDSMQRQLAKLPGAEKYHHDKLVTLEQEQAQYQKNSDKWQQIQAEPKGEAAFQCKLVAHAKTALPRLVASKKSRIRSIERKRSQAVKKLEHAELVRGTAWYVELIDVIFPMSHARDDNLRRWEEAKTRLAAFD